MFAALILLACLLTVGLPCVVFRRDHQTRIDAIAGLFFVEVFAFLLWLVFAEGASLAQALWLTFGMGVLHAVLVLVSFAIVSVILPVKDGVWTGIRPSRGAE